MSGNKRRLTGYLLTGLALMAQGSANAEPAFSTAKASIYDVLETAAREHSIPPLIFRALAQAESGAKMRSGDFRPWPWTLNVNKTGMYFASREAAHGMIQESLSRGRRSIDIGLMQVNWLYQGHRFDSPWAALDAETNTRVAAQILTDGHRATGDWWQAVGLYHSPGSKDDQRARAKAHIARVKSHWKQMTEQASGR